MKHGPIALIDEDLPVVAIAADDAVFEKSLGNIQEAKARGGRVIVVTNASTRSGTREILHPERDVLLMVPNAHPLHHAGAAGDPAAVARVSRRDSSRVRCRSAEEPGEERDGGVSHPHAGSSNQNVLPDGTRGSTPMVPPCASIASLQNARPSPVEW